MKRTIVVAAVMLAFASAFVVASFFPPLVSEAAAKGKDDN